MSIFNLFNRKNSNNSSKKENDAITLLLEDLFLIQPDKRDLAWIKAFNASIKRYTFKNLDPEIIEDKIGKRYQNLSLEKDRNSTSIEHYIDSSLENGVGISINVADQNPNWQFTYGDLLDYSLNGMFYSGRISEPFTGIVVDRYINNVETTIGQPSEKYLPQNARKNIRTFLSSFNLHNVKIALILWRNDNKLTLAFNIVPEQFLSPKADDLQSLLYFLSWYFPNQHSIIFIKETQDFVLL